jgi:hypothetical protein
VFLIGSQLRPGIHRKHPGLSTLHRGGLRFGCDLRRIYAEVLRRRLPVKPQRVLGPGFSPLRLIAG